jgi:hypothetical protein
LGGPIFLGSISGASYDPSTQTNCNIWTVYTTGSYLKNHTLNQHVTFGIQLNNVTRYLEMDFDINIQCDATSNGPMIVYQNIITQNYNLVSCFFDDLALTIPHTQFVEHQTVYLSINAIPVDIAPLCNNTQCYSIGNYLQIHTISICVPPNLTVVITPTTTCDSIGGTKYFILDTTNNWYGGMFWNTHITSTNCTLRFIIDFLLKVPCDRTLAQRMFIETTFSILTSPHMYGFNKVDKKKITYGVSMQEFKFSDKQSDPIVANTILLIKYFPLVAFLGLFGVIITGNVVGYIKSRTKTKLY